MTVNVSSDSEPDHTRDTQRQTRRNAAPPAAGAPEESGADDDIGITGQASSMWNQTINQNPELSGILKALEKYIPFVVIVTVKCLFEHATGESYSFKKESSFPASKRIFCFLKNGPFKKIYNLPLKMP